MTPLAPGCVDLSLSAWPECAVHYDQPDAAVARWALQRKLLSKGESHRLHDAKRGRRRTDLRGVRTARAALWNQKRSTPPTDTILDLPCRHLQRPSKIAWISRHSPPTGVIFRPRSPTGPRTGLLCDQREKSFAGLLPVEASALVRSRAAIGRSIEAS